MKTWLVRLVVLAALVALGLVLRATWLAPEPLEVEVAAVARGRVEETVTNSRAGTVEARRRARLSPEVGGRVAELPFREGDQVQAGAVVLRLEDSLQRAGLELAERARATARAEHERACLEAERAARELVRVGKLAAGGIISDDDLDRAQTAADAARAGCAAAAANVAQSESTVGLRRSELDKVVLRAPFDGIVAVLSIEVGEWTTPSPPAMPVPPVLDLLDPGSIYVSAPMDEVDSARIAPGQAVRVTVDSLRGRSLEGRVTRVAPYVETTEQQNRTVEIEVELADAALARTLLPGTSADVEVVLDARDDVLRLPTAALLEGKRVLLLDNGKLADRQVETGLRNWSFTEIKAGLAVGDLVVTSLDREEIQAGAAAVPAKPADAAP